jgi:hypothetical protein
MNIERDRHIASPVQVTCWRKSRRDFATFASCFQPPLIKEPRTFCGIQVTNVWSVSFNSNSLTVIFKNIRDLSDFWASDQCGPLETPPATRKRTHASITNLRSQKRRRSSVASFDLGRDLDIDDTLSVNENHNGSSSVSTKDPHPICINILFFFWFFDRPIDLYRRDLKILCLWISHRVQGVSANSLVSLTTEY